VQSTINIPGNTTRSQGKIRGRIDSGVYCVPIKHSAPFSFGVLEVVSQESTGLWKEFSLLSLFKTELAFLSFQNNAMKLSLVSF
jgi:hypothetical protein